jgi:hypothetical protein
MEDNEERVLAQAAHKPLCWFRYVGDTFIIRPLESEKLESFFDHLNGLHRNSHFAVDKGIDGHLIFLGIDIYRRSDGSLDHQVFRKPTHTNPYLSPQSHPSNIQAVLSALVYRARALYDNPHDELGVPQDNVLGKWL